MDITKMASGFRKSLELKASEGTETPNRLPDPTRIYAKFLIVFQYEDTQYCTRVSATTAREALQLARIDAAMQGYSGDNYVSVGLLIPDCSSMVDH